MSISSSCWRRSATGWPEPARSTWTAGPRSTPWWGRTDREQARGLAARAGGTEQRGRSAGTGGGIVIRADSGLRFWLDYVEWSDGLWEGAGDVALVVLPPRLAAEFALPDEVQVTGDPDVAREDGATFLAAGHPAVIRAAEAALESGDVGVVTLARPRSLPPSAAALQDKARERFPVDHGRIDAVGEPRPVFRGVLRAGAVVNYAVSTEDRFQERVECWVDLPTGLALPDRVSGRLASGAVAAQGARCDSLAELDAGVARVYQTLEAAALRRRQDLAGQATKAHDTERRRAEEYYDA